MPGLDALAARAAAEVALAGPEGLTGGELWARLAPLRALPGSPSDVSGAVKDLRATVWEALKSQGFSLKPPLGPRGGSPTEKSKRKGRRKTFLGDCDVLLAPERIRLAALGLCACPAEVPAPKNTERLVLEAVGRAGQAGVLQCHLQALCGLKTAGNASRLVKELAARGLVHARICTWDPRQPGKPKQKTNLVRLVAFAGVDERPAGVTEHIYEELLKHVERVLEQAEAQKDGSKLLPESGVKKVLGFCGVTGQHNHRSWRALMQRIIQEEEYIHRLQYVTVEVGDKKVECLRLLPSDREATYGKEDTGRGTGVPPPSTSGSPRPGRPSVRPGPSAEHSLPQAFLQAVAEGGAEGVTQNDLVRSLGTPAEWLQHAHGKLEPLLRKGTDEEAGRKTIKFYSACLGVDSATEKMCAQLVPDNAERVRLADSCRHNVAALLRASAALSALRSPNNEDGFLINLDVRSVLSRHGPCPWSNTVAAVQDAITGAGLAKIMVVRVAPKGAFLVKTAADGGPREQQVLVRLDVSVTGALKTSAARRIQEATEEAAKNGRGGGGPTAFRHRPTKVVLQADSLQSVHATTALRGGAAAVPGEDRAHVGELYLTGMLRAHLGRAYTLHKHFCADMAAGEEESAPCSVGASVNGAPNALRETVGRLSVVQVYEVLGSPFDLGDEERLFRDLSEDLQLKVWDAASSRLNNVAVLLSKLGLVGGGGGCGGGFSPTEGVSLHVPCQVERGEELRWETRDYDFKDPGAFESYWADLKAAAETGVHSLPKEVLGKKAFHAWYTTDPAEVKCMRAESYTKRTVHFNLGRLVNEGGEIDEGALAALCREKALLDDEVREHALQQYIARESRRYKQAERDCILVKESCHLVDTTDMPGRDAGEKPIFALQPGATPVPKGLRKRRRGEVPVEDAWTEPEDVRLLGAYFSEVNKRGPGFRWESCLKKERLPVEGREALSHDRRVEALKKNKVTHDAVVAGLHVAKQAYYMCSASAGAEAGADPGEVQLLEALREGAARVMAQAAKGLLKKEGGAAPCWRAALKKLRRGPGPRLGGIEKRARARAGAAAHRTRRASRGRTSRAGGLSRRANPGVKPKTKGIFSSDFTPRQAAARATPSGGSSRSSRKGIRVPAPPPTPVCEPTTALEAAAAELMRLVGFSVHCAEAPVGDTHRHACALLDAWNEQRRRRGVETCSPAGGPDAFVSRKLLVKRRQGCVPFKLGTEAAAWLESWVGGGEPSSPEQGLAALAADLAAGACWLHFPDRAWAQDPSQEEATRGGSLPLVEVVRQPPAQETPNWCGRWGSAESRELLEPLLRGHPAPRELPTAANVRASVLAAVPEGGWVLENARGGGASMDRETAGRTALLALDAVHWRGTDGAATEDLAEALASVARGSSTIGGESGAPAAGGGAGELACLAGQLAERALQVLEAANAALPVEIGARTLWVSANHCGLLGHAEWGSGKGGGVEQSPAAAAAATAGPLRWQPYRPWHALRGGGALNCRLLAALRNAAVTAAQARPGISEEGLVERLGPHLGPTAARELLDALVACGQLQRNALPGGGEQPPWCHEARPVVVCYQASDCC